MTDILTKTTRWLFHTSSCDLNMTSKDCVMSQIGVNVGDSCYVADGDIITVKVFKTSISSV